MMNKFLQDVLVIIVLYKQKLSESSAFNSILESVNQTYFECNLDVFVYDNSPYKDLDIEVAQYLNINLHYHNNPTNGGVSKAYNQGIGFAKSLKKKFAILLDQDTSFSPSLFVAYNKAIKSYPTIGIFAPVLKLQNGALFSPSKLIMNRTYTPDRLPDEVNSLKKLIPLNSGILIDVELFIEVGGYNEQIKLDFSDVDFMRRLSKKKEEFICIREEFCFHSSSNEDDKTLMNIQERYKFFCEGAKFTIRYNFLDSFIFCAIAFLRGLNLSYRTKSLSFVLIFYKYYILR